MNLASCLHCGVQFTPNPRGKGRFCSRSCWRAWEAVSQPKVTCQCCGKEFGVKPAVLRRGGGKFCGKRCESASRPSRPLVDRFWSRVLKGEGCWTWTGQTDQNGYGRMNPGGGDRVPKLVHRVSYELNVGPIPQGMGVLHRCDNPPCVRPDHLFLGTQLTNIRDCSAKGRTNRGEKSPNAKLTEEQVADIRRRYRGGEENFSRMAREFGVSRSTLVNVLEGRTWQHVS